MSRITPTLHASGRWQLKPPWSITETIVYTCVAIQSIEALIRDGVDPYSTFYAPKGISRSDYDTQRQNDTPNIVTLASDTGPRIQVPDTYIQSYPDINGVAYRHTVLSISLSAQPDSLNYADIKAKVENLVRDSLGISSSVKVHQVGYVDKTLSLEEHQRVEENRRQAIKHSTTDRAKVVTLEKEVQQLRDHNTLLADVLRAHGLLQ